MNQSFTKNGNASIINLFQKMDSNITKFKASLTSSPTLKSKEQSSCLCIINGKERKIEREFYIKQQDLVRNACTMLTSQGNQTMSRLLAFMADYLGKIGEELKHQLLCECKRQKNQQYNNLIHKISFLREENHKFFRMIEQRTQECDELKLKIQQMQASRLVKHHQNTTPMMQLKSQMHFASILSEQITSRIISSNSSRITQFRHAWPQLTLPIGQMGHKKYFEIPSADCCGVMDSREVLQQKNVNHPFENTSKKMKIFSRF